MKLLALEFSSSQRSVAILEFDHEKSREIYLHADADFRKNSSMLLVDTALRQTGTKPEEITRIAVGLGPGSYTGIRSAIAIAQGWQLARGTEVCGVSSVENLAEEARKQFGSGEVTLIIDAQKKEVYSARFELTDGGVIPLTALSIQSPSSLLPDIRIAGPDATKFMPSAINLFPSAGTLARIALAHFTPIPAEKLTPIYLREITFVKAPPPRMIE